ncbi:MAG: endolytic transglycosylase MltG [Chitinivibrionales bacterium]|nr:endolytic transglycosylase MltG [Chitinivibrionales bacterium]MBD3357763.1 endolytic transglycosylase MltG [Chitinivibrionales bacterium]
MLLSKLQGEASLGTGTCGRKNTKVYCLKRPPQPGDGILRVNPAKILARTWFTGLLVFAVCGGYIFYAFLYVIRVLGSMKVRVIMSAVAVVLVASLAVLGAFAYYFMAGGPQGERVELVVEPGASVRFLAEKLERKGVVRSARVLLVWMKITGIDKQVQAGKYAFRRKAGVVNAARELLDPEPVDTAVTVPEGLIIEQIGELFASTFSFSPDTFVALCTDTAFLRGLGFEGSSLEGFLFPDTYRFSPDVGPGEVIARMYGHFEQQFSTLDSTPIMERYSRAEIVTMASIVEKEATLAEERAHIAGVFYNRLKKGYPLGADPTVRYALRKFSGPLRVSELKNPSPYNTRVHRGLPPGPICSPGLGALAASVSPLETDDLYFVAKWDGTGAHDFSTTAAEHNRKKFEIRRLNELRKQRKKGSE